MEERNFIIIIIIIIDKTYNEGAIAQLAHLHGEKNSSRHVECI